MIVSAISLWKKFNLNTPLGASEWGIENHAGVRYSHVAYSGHAVEDGSVRIYAQFSAPIGEGKKPAILLLGDVGVAPSRELANYFVEKGYAVLMPDYSGKMTTDEDGVMRTVYPASIEYGNFERARGLYDLKDVEVDATTWFEWAYVALFSVEYLKSREDIGNIGVVGIRKGGEIAWQTMLSPDVKCGVPVNAVGWYSFRNIAKFGDNIAHNLSDETHRYIAAVESQSYAPYVKCPVLMLCALRDTEFDCDRAYDTYSRIGGDDGNALVYSPDSGACIGPNALTDMDLFLEKNLKGREIYIPDTLNVTLTESDDGLVVDVEFDKEGILEEAGVFYAEADVQTKSAYRDWQCVYTVSGKSVKNGTTRCTIKPFSGAKAAFVYAYAKYINGFRVMSKVVCKRLSSPHPFAVKSRRLFSGTETDCFGVAEYSDYSVGGIFLEREAVPKIVEGYGGVKGAYSVGGIKTYKISSPMYIPDENAMLEFDAYFKETDELTISIDVADVTKESERYTCIVPVKGGGKWKRIILKAADFKGEICNMPLNNFYDGRAILFSCENEETEFAVTNILWL
ncbi:MAG: dienelactone hydrolase family protein [Clostridia bacterium]|nr:dienelactone hydrolase family protein [Clostridia bacterium]